MNKQKILIIISILVIIGCIIASTFIIKNSKKVNETVDDLNNIENTNLLSDTTYDSLEIVDQIFHTSESSSIYMATITNNQDSDYIVDTLYVTFYLNEETISGIALLNTTIKAGESIPVSINFDTNLKEVTKIEYTKDIIEEVTE